MELEESVRTISALFNSAGNGIAPTSMEFGSSDQPLEARVASISAEIAAAIAQAQVRAYEDDEEEDEESGSGQEMAVLETIGPNTSGIRGDDGGAGPRSNSKEAARMVEEEFEDEDGDAFPVPLRTRKAKTIGVGIGTKRKRWGALHTEINIVNIVGSVMKHVMPLILKATRPGITSSVHCPFLPVSRL
jgi:hypothetical protein